MFHVLVAVLVATSKTWARALEPGPCPGESGPRP